MIEAGQFVAAAARRGYDFYAGVPCSFLTPFINRVIGDPALTYVSSANEGDAVATAAGAWIGGRRSVAMMQNSGLGNAVSPLTSLTYVFRIPILLVCTHRGAPGVSDEPQHALMGEITGEMLTTLRLPWEEFPHEAADIVPALERARAYATRERRPYAMVMQKNACAPHPLDDQGPPRRPHAAAIAGEPFARPPSARLSRADVLARMIELAPLANSVVIATTGFTGRELYALADRANQLYMVGSMGCAASLGLGLALARPDRTIVVVDGDGAALMRLGNLATVGTYGPSNLVHVLLDNEAHDSTGAQSTVTANVDFAAIAQATGYAYAARGEELAALDEAFAAAGRDGSSFLHMKIRCGARADLPRPSIAPADILTRLVEHLGNP